MALSDACFEFTDAISIAAVRLAEQVHWYSAPDNPLRYGSEIDALRRACVRVSDNPGETETLIDLIRLASAVQRFHDAPPDTFGEAERQERMNSLIKTLQADLEPDEAMGVPAVIQNVIVEGADTSAAAHRLKALLPRLGKAAYDMSIKVLSDIASTTAKKILGLGP